MKRMLVTGGAGFIGSALVRRILTQTPHNVLVYDKLTYAGNLASLAPVSASPRYSFVRADICDAAAAARAFGGGFRVFGACALRCVIALAFQGTVIDGPGFTYGFGRLFIALTGFDV